MNVRKSLRVVSLMFLVFTLSMAAIAQRRPNGGGGRWQYLGQAHVDGARDRDTISVDDRGTFRALQIEVRDAPIEFQRVVVHFENGGDHEVEVRDRVRAGQRTRVIDLPGDQRRIRSVEFWYGKARYGSRRPTLRLYGVR